MKQTIAVFFGGKSTEHDISIITALSAIIKPLEITGNYKVVPVYITKDGRWFSDDKLKDISIYRTGEIDDFIAKNKPILINLNGGLSLVKDGFKKQSIQIDVAFPSMHGMYGEDGSLMGVLRMANVPFVGSDMAASVISMDKVLSKQIAELARVPVSKYLHFVKVDFEKDLVGMIDDCRTNLSFPMFIKPAHLGSSIGITKANNETELKNAIEVAFYYDNKVIVEEAVGNLIEVTVPVIGNAEPIPSLVEKALFKSDEFFDFETKYLNQGGKKGGKGSGKKTSGSQGYSELPAALEGDLYDRSIKTALTVYKAVGCEGISRIDLLIDSKTNVVYFNEINPLPGSLYAHNWRKNGVSSVQLVEKLIGYAIERFEQNKKTETVFESSFLKQF